MSTRWTREQLHRLDISGSTTPVCAEGDTRPILPELYLWDLWPLRHRDGTLARLEDSEVWMALSAPSELAPGERHDVARIRLISRDDRGWSDRGPVFPDGASAGSREWAGCATYHDGRVEVLYTAAGRRAETSPSFVQRIIRAEGRLNSLDVGIEDWSPHQELITPSDRYASTRDQDTGEPGFIKAFRDPFRFEDPVSGETVVLFTASMFESATDFDGAIGIAEGPGIESLALLPPLITADGVNNELERPHLVRHEGLYYLFFSTQARTFHPEVAGVTGLYGFVGDALDGDWAPLNGSGLVLANPEDEPFQAYSWLVLHDLTVCSFIDFHSLGGRHPDDLETPGAAREHFGGTLAPFERLQLDDTRARLVDRL